MESVDNPPRGPVRGRGAAGPDCPTLPTLPAWQAPFRAGAAWIQHHHQQTERFEPGPRPRPSALRAPGLRPGAASRETGWTCPAEFAELSVHYCADHPALLRARRRRLRWSEEDRRLHDRHRWRSEGFRGEAKTWHGLGRAARRGLGNMRIQSYLTAAAINLKRLVAAFCARFSAIGTIRMRGTALSALLARQAGPGRRRPARCAWLRAANPRAGRRRVASRNLRKAA